MWLPWAAGVALLLTLATVALTAGGRVESGVRVPRAVLEAQQNVTSIAAQSVRRSLNEGIDDLTSLATALSLEGVTDSARLHAQLGALAELHDRYRSLYVLDQAGSVVAGVGAHAHPNLLPADVSQPGVTPGVDVAGTDVVAQYAPLEGTAGSDWVLVGEYDPSFLQNALDSAAPASVWVVDAAGRVMGSNVAFAPWQHVDRSLLREAARRAATEAGHHVGARSGGASEVVAWAPAIGEGPAGLLGWGVISSRSLDSVALPQTQAREHALIFGTLLLVITVGVFGWLQVMLLLPMRRIRIEAERLAGGDLREPVEIRRYDEIGLLGRSLERLRTQLVHRRTHESIGADAEDGYR